MEGPLIMCVSPISFHMEILLYQHDQSAIDTSRILFLLASTLGASCGLAMNHPIQVSVLTPPRRCFCSLFIISMCAYVYVHISLFLPECACTTIISLRLGFRRNFLSVLHPREQTENFFGILISTRLAPQLLILHCEYLV